MTSGRGSGAHGDAAPSIPPAEYATRARVVRAELLVAQQAVRRAGAGPVIVILGGPETAGRGETANLLNAWMDPRSIATRAWGPPSDEERERPPFWRYWRALPARGEAALFLNAWYEPAVIDLIDGRITKKAFARRMTVITAVERALVDDGAVLLKCWLHVDAATHRRRLEAFAADPLTAWRAGKRQWRQLKGHDAVVRAARRAMRLTDTVAAPWRWIESADPDYRHLRVATLVRDAWLDALAVAAGRGRTHPVGSTAAAATGVPDLLARVDLARALDKKRARVALERQQGRLHLAQHKAHERGLSTVVVFEGWDAAGKGGAIRRITGALDAVHYRVIPIAAPTDEERAHHYLWRFWRHLSRAGHVTIFDRSWYGRLLVERVERLARPDEWRRAYDEITAFETQLVDHGIIVVKFWLHISKAEQLRRFTERRETPHKQWKITDEDWRNRRRWDGYVGAVNEMLERTSTRQAPWVVVAADDKRHARVEVVKTLADAIRRGVKRRPR